MKKVREKRQYAGARVDNLLSADYEKLKEQNRRLKAAIARVKACERLHGTVSGGLEYMYVCDVQEALRLRK